MTVQRIVALVAGVLFLALAGLMVYGFRGISTYPLWMRISLAILLLIYGVWRVRGAWRGAARGRQN